METYHKFDNKGPYACIDLKSFYASVECVDRGLDPFKVNLVVADESRGKGSICLAITPAMKARGVKNRCRLFEIPRHISYITAPPRMHRYMEVAAQIYGIYLDYMAPEDIHVYSIDEVFLDFGPYGPSRGMKSGRALTQELMAAVFQQTGVCATGGVGTNLFLAKVALDILAKHAPDNIGELDELSFQRRIWHHRPITDIWQIGPGIARRLAAYGVHDLYGVTQLSEDLLYKSFGVDAELLIDHAWGRESCTMEDIHNYRTSSKSLSKGQILFRDYSFEEALLPLREMVDTLVLDLVKQGYKTRSISLRVGYSDDRWRPGGSRIPSTGLSKRLIDYSDSYQYLSQLVEEAYYASTHRDHPIRRLNISFGHLGRGDDLPLMEDLFAQDLSVGRLSREQEEKEGRLQRAVAQIQNKFGKNAILRAMSLEDHGTARIRNGLIGGHRGGEGETIE